MKECLFYTRLGDGSVRCDLCAHRCTLASGQRGLCKSRRNAGGVMVSDVYGHPCALAVDPVEKKPLAMFHPGTRCLSMACSGCNLRCLNCQNHDISQAAPCEVYSSDVSPEAMVGMALERGLPSIAYTYTEPLTYIEYVLEIARLAHRHGLYNILVSAGYVNVQPLNELAPLIDAANIDLKAFDDMIYARQCGAHLQPVLDTLLTLKAAGTHLEITHLLIPQVNDDMTMFNAMCRWLVDNGLAGCPLHLTRFFPRYRMLDSIATPRSTLLEARDIALRAGIEHVFLGNI